MRKFIATLSAIVLAGCNPPVVDDVHHPPGSVVILEKTYRLVQAPQLERALKGRQLVDDPCLNTNGCTDRFSSDGHSLERTGDIVSLVFGQYTISGNRFCTTMEKDWPRCRALFRAGDGTYATMKFDGRWRDAVVVRTTQWHH